MTDRIKDEANRILRDLGDEGAWRLVHELKRRVHVADPKPTDPPLARKALKDAISHAVEEMSDEWQHYCWKAASSLAEDMSWPSGNWCRAMGVIMTQYVPIDLIQEVLAEVLGEMRAGDGLEPYDWDGNAIKDHLLT